MPQVRILPGALSEQRGYYSAQDSHNKGDRRDSENGVIMSSTNTTAALALTSAFHDVTAARNQVLHTQQDLAGARATRTAQLPTKHKGQSHESAHWPHQPQPPALPVQPTGDAQAVGSAVLDRTAGETSFACGMTRCPSYSRRSELVDTTLGQSVQDCGRLALPWRWRRDLNPIQLPSQKQTMSSSCVNSSYQFTGVNCY